MRRFFKSYLDLGLMFREVVEPARVGRNLEKLATRLERSMRDWRWFTCIYFLLSLLQNYCGAGLRHLPLARKLNVLKCTPRFLACLRLD